MSNLPVELKGEKQNENPYFPDAQLNQLDHGSQVTQAHRNFLY